MDSSPNVAEVSSQEYFKKLFDTYSRTREPVLQFFMHYHGSVAHRPAVQSMRSFSMLPINVSSLPLWARRLEEAVIELRQLCQESVFEEERALAPRLASLEAQLRALFGALPDFYLRRLSEAVESYHGALGERFSALYAEQLLRPTPLGYRELHLRALELPARLTRSTYEPITSQELLQLREALVELEVQYLLLGEERAPRL